ncbi:MAG: lipopolysaccharide biosynthesis protein [Candidatus Zixiibacteriota bacterium]|nr:MAG: lipopolysaccharide biosynthesis protein [candidate division Zixibacteria bacterium]
MAELKGKVLSGLKWSVGGKAATQLITWASTIIVMRLLNPDDYGLMAMATVFIALCMLINEMGLGAALVQSKSVSDTLLRQVYSMVLLINGSLFVILVAGSPLIAMFFEEKRLIAIVSVLAFQFIAVAFSVVPSALLTREMNFRAKSIVEVVAMLTSSILTLSLALLGSAVWALVFGALAHIVVRSIGYNIAKPSFRRPTTDFKGFAERAKFGGYMSITRVLWYVYSQADVFIVGKLLGKTLLGYYSVAMHIASLPMQKVGSIMHEVGLPAYSQLQDNKELAANYALKAARAISVVAFPVFFGISSVSPELVSLVLGEKWLPAIPALQLLSLIIPLRTIQISVGPAVSGLGRPDVNVRNLVVACVVMPTAFVIGVKWGLVGVSLAWLIGFSLWFLYMLSQSLPVIGVSVSRFLKTMLTPAFYSGVMYAAVYATKLALTSWDANAVLTLVVMIVIGALVYAGCMLAFSRDTCREVWGMIRS